MKLLLTKNGDGYSDGLRVIAAVTTPEEAKEALEKDHGYTICDDDIEYLLSEGKIGLDLTNCDNEALGGWYGERTYYSVSLKGII